MYWKQSDSLECVCLIMDGEMGWLWVGLVSGTGVSVTPDVTKASVWNDSVVGTALVGARGVVGGGLVTIGAKQKLWFKKTALCLNRNEIE